MNEVTVKRNIPMNWSCQNCTERHIGCHATCERYISESKQFSDYKKGIREVKEANNAAIEDNEIRKRKFNKRKQRQR